MREIVLHKGLKRTKVMIYTDIDQLPAERFSKVNIYNKKNNRRSSE